MSITQALLTLAPLTMGTPQTLTASIDLSQTQAPISPYIYGQFLEHIGDIVNSGIWAEMLDDRKFYNPVRNRTEAPPRPNPRRAAPRMWSPVGGPDVVQMDSRTPFTGEHSPTVRVEKESPRGMEQAGISVMKDRVLTGRIYLSGTPGTKVQVSLMWGSLASQKQTVEFSPQSKDWKKYTFHFTPGASIENARFSITGTGAGNFRVGAVSLMPADNVKGFRIEVVRELKKLKSGVYRFPGGNFVSAHDWRDAVGDIDKRPPIFDPVWNAVQPNDVGTDEFLTLCDLLGVEPYICVNTGFGDAHSAAQLVEYVNGSAKSDMGKWRAENGHPKPYKVKFWGVGNEMFGDWQFGYMPMSQYVHKHKIVAKAMRKVDPTIKLVAVGAMPDVMAGSKMSQRLVGKPVPEFLSVADWTGGMFSNCLDHMDYLSEHFYTSSTQKFEPGSSERTSMTSEELTEWVRSPATQVRVKVEHYQEYLNRIPALRKKPVPIVMDEWAHMGPAQNSFRLVPAYAGVFHEFFRHSDLYQMGNFTFATALYHATRQDATLNPAGLLFQMYREQFGSIPVALDGNSPLPIPTNADGGNNPKLNPGSATYPLDVTAALTADRKFLTIAVMNPTLETRELQVSYLNGKLVTTGDCYRLAPSDKDATIEVGKRPGVEIEHLTVGQPDKLTVPPYSVSIYRYEVGK